MVLESSLCRIPHVTYFLAWSTENSLHRSITMLSTITNDMSTMNLDNGLFSAITNDGLDSRKEDGEGCKYYKRRKLQKSCSKSQYLPISVLGMSSAPAIPHPICTESVRPITQNLALQLAYDLPAFIERAKQIFCDNNSDTSTINSNVVPISNDFILNQQAFVNQAIVEYLRHFVPESSCHRVKEIPSHIPEDSFLQTPHLTALDSDCSQEERSFQRSSSQ